MNIDARGLACPQPVLLVRKALQGLGDEGVLSVLVADEAARDNVRRFAESQGCVVQATEGEEGSWELTVAKGFPCSLPSRTRAEALCPPVAPAPSAAPTLGAASAPVLDPAPAPSLEPAQGPGPRIVVYLNAETIGRGDEELGRVLMHAFLGTFREVEPLMDHLILVNGAVKVNVQGNPLVEDLEALERLGVEVLTCGTCVDFYGLKGKIAVGRLTNTFEVATLLSRAARVVSP